MKKWLLYQIPNTKYVFFQKDVQSVQMSVIMFKIHCFEADHPAEGGIFVNWYRGLSKIMHAGWKRGTLGKTVNNTTCLQLKFSGQET